MTTPKEPKPPAVPPRVRTVAYSVGLAVAALTLTIPSLADIWLPAEDALRITASAGVISAGFGVVAAGLGVIYRPTR